MVGHPPGVRRIRASPPALDINTARATELQAHLALTRMANSARPHPCQPLDGTAVSLRWGCCAIRCAERPYPALGA